MSPNFPLIFTIVLLTSGVGHSQVTDFWDVDFTKADSVAFLYHGHDLKHPEKLAELLVRDLPTQELKFRAIFRWITTDIKYDYPLYLQLIQKEKKLAYKKQKFQSYLTKFSKKTFRQTILKKTAVCAGYAMLLEYMCNHVGIECETVTGYARGNDLDLEGARRPNHAWNAVFLRGKWYLCDATWASGNVDPQRKLFRRRYNASYFLTDPALLICNHYPTNDTWTLLLDEPSLSEFLAAPFLMEGFIRNKINTYSPAKMTIRAKVNQPVQFRFTSNVKLIEKPAQLLILKGKKEINHDVKLQMDNTGTYFFEQSFTEHGTHIIYIAVNGHYTFAYRVVVSPGPPPERQIKNNF